MAITIPDEGISYMYMESMFIAEATIPKQKLNERLATLLPFQVALLLIVKNDLIIAWIHTGPIGVATRGHVPKFLAYIAILCFGRRYPKQK